jgi:hypothetical protein
MTEPRQLTKEIEERVEVPPGEWERFSGYGVMGLPFTSGHVLALRSFPATSLGMGYRSIWHRNPEGDWSFYQTISAKQSCPRYFGSALTKAQQVGDIEIIWTGANDFRVSIKENVQFEWKISLTTTPATRLMNSIASLIPEPLWQKSGFLNFMGGVASVMLGAGHLGLNGKTPNGQKFIAAPRKIWSVAESTASIQGQSFGTMKPLQKQARLGDFWIPQRGIFAIGNALFETYNPAYHQIKLTEKEI